MRPVQACSRPFARSEGRRLQWASVGCGGTAQKRTTLHLHTCALSSDVSVPALARVDFETVENGAVCSCRLILCGFLHRIPHRDHGPTLASRYIKDW